MMLIMELCILSSLLYPFISGPLKKGRKIAAVEDYHNRRIVKLYIANHRVVEEERGVMLQYVNRHRMKAGKNPPHNMEEQGDQNLMITMALGRCPASLATKGIALRGVTSVSVQPLSFHHAPVAYPQASDWRGDTFKKIFF